MVPTVAYSCFVLHNYCEIKGKLKTLKKLNYLDDEKVRAQILRHQTEEESQPNVPDPVYSCETSEGDYVRTVLTKCIQ